MLFEVEQGAKRVAEDREGVVKDAPIARGAGGQICIIYCYSPVRRDRIGRAGAM